MCFKALPVAMIGAERGVEFAREPSDVHMFRGLFEYSFYRVFGAKHACVRDGVREVCFAILSARGLSEPDHRKVLAAKPITDRS